MGDGEVADRVGWEGSGVEFREGENVTCGHVDGVDCIEVVNTLIPLQTNTLSILTINPQISHWLGPRAYFDSRCRLIKNALSTPA